MKNHSEKGINSPQRLLESLEIKSNIFNQDAHKLFKTRVPQAFIAKMQLGNPDDPLLRQVLPTSDELTRAPGFSGDPLDEQHSSPMPGVLHKYHGRILLILSGACAVNCRYCFRRNFPYQQNILRPEAWAKLLTYLKANPSISEVIYSGGDPLLVKQERLLELSQLIASLAQIKTLRIHSRIPVVDPQRVTDSFIDLLTGIPLRKVLVIHVNHPNEINLQVVELMQKLRSAHIMLLNQTVLLKGINDKADILQSLCEKLFDAGILPYYLHLLDRVQGAAHFEVKEPQAQRLYGALLQRLPGYLVPRLVREQVGIACKVPICPNLDK